MLSRGIANKITLFTYERGDYVYLEEDYDLSTYVKALYKLEGTTTIEQTEFVRKFRGSITTTYTNNSSRIRSYNPYQILAPEDKKKLIELRTKLLNHSNWNKKRVRIIKNFNLIIA